MTRIESDPRSAAEGRAEPRIGAPRHARKPAALVALVALSWAGTLAAQMPLPHAVPSDAFMFQHWRSTPESAFLDEHYRGVCDAIVQADFPGMLVDEVLPTVLGSDDLEQVRAVEGLVSRLLGDVPWQDLGEHEVVFAMRQHAPAFGRPGHGRSDFQMFVGSRVDQDALGPSYDALTRIFTTARQMAHDSVSITVVIDDGEGRRELEGADALAAARSHLGTDVAVQCDLALLIDDDDDFGWQHLASLMFVEDKVCATFSRDADAFAHDALAALRGCGVDRIVESDRLKQAFVGLPDGYERVYFDMPVMLSPMMRTVERISSSEKRGAVQDVETAIWAETFSLLDCFGSIAVTTHVENGHQVSDSVMRYRDDPAVRDNPIFRSSVAASGNATNDMLAFVPADATAFSMHAGVDLVPLHDWALDRLASYVPKAEELYIPMFEAGQAAFGIDVRDELLPLLGSPSITVTVPKQSGGIDTGVGETVVVTRPARPDASRELERRLVGVAGHMLPALVDTLRSELRDAPVEFDARLVANDGAFRTLHKLELDFRVGPISQSQGLLFGHVGPLQVASTSEEAIAYVLETYAGEFASVLEEGPLVELDALPDGRVSSIVLTDIGASLEQASMAMRQAAGFMPSIQVNTGNADSDRILRIVKASVGGTLRRVGDIYSSLDFLGRSVMSTRVDPNTGAMYTRSILEIRDDD